MITLALTAKNSSGVQRLIFDLMGDGTVNPTLLGEYDGGAIQIDFDELSQQDLKDLISILQGRVLP